MITVDEFLTEEQLEQRLQLKKGSLKLRRHRGVIIPHSRFGSNTIRYHWPTVKEFLLGPQFAQKGQSASLPPQPRKRGRPRLVPKTNPAILQDSVHVNAHIV